MAASWPAAPRQPRGAPGEERHRIPAPRDASAPGLTSSPSAAGCSGAGAEGGIVFVVVVILIVVESPRHDGIRGGTLVVVVVVVVGVLVVGVLVVGFLVVVVILIVVLVVLVFLVVLVVVVRVVGIGIRRRSHRPHGVTKGVHVGVVFLGRRRSVSGALVVIILLLLLLLLVGLVLLVVRLAERGDEHGLGHAGMSSLAREDAMESTGTR